jgi:D-alanyl-D-alanine carboxypeptidase (penicillin-binding protein 5/6)
MLTRRAVAGGILVGAVAAAAPTPRAAWAAPRRAWGDAPTQAAAGIVIEGDNRNVVWAREPNVPRPMASTTKVMSALLVLESVPLHGAVAVGENAFRRGQRQNETRMGLRLGELFSVEELLFGMLLDSANDAAVALAEAVAGTEAAFVRRMNARAAELGLASTTYSDVYGLASTRHSTSPADLASLSATAMWDATFARVVATRTRVLPQTGAHARYQLTNLNKLLWRVPGTDGVKGGWTGRAGQCLVCSVTRGSRWLVLVLLRSPSVYDEMQAVVEWAFRQPAVASAQELARVPAAAAQPGGGAALLDQATQ